MTDQSHQGPVAPIAPTRDDFTRIAEAQRRALKLHCYRMLGSLHEAEDAVQETLLRAWRAFDAFEARASIRNWLYRIATNVALNILESRSRRGRVAPEQLGASSTGRPRGQPDVDALWVEPYPDAELERLPDPAAGPDGRYELRESVRLAFIVAIQQLPPRQRAALLLADVLGWSALEVAAVLDRSVASVNSALQRARATLATLDPAAPPRPLSDDARRSLLERYVQAWESADLDRFVALLKEDATYSMPPWREWYRGKAVAGFFRGCLAKLSGVPPPAGRREPAARVRALHPGRSSGVGTPIPCSFCRWTREGSQR